MIKTHSDDPDVAQAAADAASVIQNTLSKLPAVETFDYGGHVLKITDYGLCERCTRPIAEAQAAAQALKTAAAKLDDATIKEHVDLAAQLFTAEAEAATVRAELHNGKGSENILNNLLAYQYDRGIHEEYSHSHHGGAQ